MNIDIAMELAEIKKIEFDDYPDQEAEYREQKAVELALEAVHRIAEQMVSTVAEEELVEFRVAHKIVERADAKLIAAVLRERLTARSDYRQEINDAAL